MYQGGAMQQWNISPTGDGYYSIGSLGSGKYLDLFECSIKDGTKISQYPWFNNDCQKWRIEQTGDGTYRIVAKAGSALTLPGGTKTPQAVVQGYAWKGDSSQQWLFQKP
jgi:mannan endo-1,4-beta-mannosidase